MEAPAALPSTLPLRYIRPDHSQTLEAQFSTLWTDVVLRMLDERGQVLVRIPLQTPSPVANNGRFDVPAPYYGNYAEATGVVARADLVKHGLPFFIDLDLERKTETTFKVCDPKTGKPLHVTKGQTVGFGWGDCSPQPLNRPAPAVPQPCEWLDRGMVWAYQGGRKIAEWPLNAATPDDPKRDGWIWVDGKTWGFTVPAYLMNRGDITIELRSWHEGAVARIVVDTTTRGRGPYFLEFPLPADTPAPPERWEEFLLMERNHGLPVRVRRGPMMNDDDVRKVLDRLRPHFVREVRRRERKAIGDDVVVDRLLPEEEV